MAGAALAAGAAGQHLRLGGVGPPAGAALAPAGWRRRPGLPAALPEAGAEAFRVHSGSPLRETQKGKSEPGWGLEPSGQKKNENDKFWFRDVLACTGICFIACRNWNAIQETRFRKEKKRVHG